MNDRLTVRINDKQLLADFKAHVLNKNGRLYAALSIEVETALKNHLAIEGVEKYCEQLGVETSEPAAHTNFSQRQKKFLATFQKRFFMDNQIGVKVLRAFIKEELHVLDDRTIEKWEKFLMTVGWIKRASTVSWENKTPTGEEDLIEVG
ncbi:hypothetical protein FGU46_03130 [Methanobacterium sp. CWC-01]|uniref:hypothetical protein n=1 Tax=Methanobacterium aridiramus TaxID=2584467 RepID=UPI002576EE6C|nr:hypothetical protein [Methanobacterium sp. CWC-01]WJI09153.1 hypothetical protein FGU46_03130 [Methanobacterium sp. CWC-01]